MEYEVWASRERLAITGVRWFQRAGMPESSPRGWVGPSDGAVLRGTQTRALTLRQETADGGAARYSLTSDEHHQAGRFPRGGGGGVSPS